MNFLNISFFTNRFKAKADLSITTTFSGKYNKDIANISSKNLHDNLKQLEFISCLEMHLDTKKEGVYSLNFLQDISKIKHSVQINTIQSIQYYKR